MKKALIFAITILMALSLVACNKVGKLYPIMDMDEDGISYKFYNANMDLAFDQAYDDVISYFEGDYAVVYKGNQIQIINKTGQSLVDGDFDSVADINGDRAILNKAGKNILYDLKAQKALATYDYIKAEASGIFAYMDGGKWGYRNINEVIVDPTYDEAYSFGVNYAVAIKDGTPIKIDKKGEESPLAYEEVLKAGDSDYLIGLKDGSVDFLNADGEAIFTNIKGDIVDINYDMLVINQRVGGSIKSAIYSVKGKELVPADFDDVRLLSKKYFSARGKDGFGLFKTDGTRLTDYKYYYLNADNFDSNGGIICAIRDDAAYFLDKNGVEIDAPTAEGTIDVKKDENFYIISTMNEVLYFDKDKNLVKTSLIPKPLEHLSYIIEDQKPYIFSKKLPAGTNQALYSAIDDITRDDRKIELNIHGDILFVTVKTAKGDPTFMFDISVPGKVELADLFTESDMRDRLIAMSAFKDEADIKIVGFVLENDLDVYFKKGDEFLKEKFAYEDIDDYLDKDQATFFKSVLAPSINVGD